MNLAAAKRQRIDCASRCGALRYLVDEIENGALVRHGDIESLAARTLELSYGRLEFLGSDLQ